MDNIQKFDKLNNLTFEQYFGAMTISKSQKKERVNFAKVLMDILLYVFSWADVAHANDMNLSEIEEEIDNTLEWRLWDSIPTKIKHLMPDGATVEDTYDMDLKAIPGLRDHIDAVALSIASVTAAHLDDEYYTSYDRAFEIAGSETNAIYNASEYNQAVASGKTTKTWHTVKDEKTRVAHWDVDGQTVPITQYFIVGGEPMKYAHDINASVNNTANCRCSTSYQ